MNIKLPYVNEIDSINQPDNLQEIVCESFKQFTKGTDKNYQFIDKLGYIDNLRRIINGNKENDIAVRDLIGDNVKHNIDEYGDMPVFSDILSTEFMETCYEEGFRPLKLNIGKYHNETLKMIADIVKFVMNYEEKNDEVNL